MRELGIEGVIRGQRRRTTVPEPSAPHPPDLVDRDFTASRPDQLWVADMTYVPTWSGWAYVAFVLDVYSRMIVGWQVANHMRTELPLDALEMALWRQRIKTDSGLIHHSDRGSQYVLIRYTDRLADIGASASVGSVADSYDCEDGITVAGCLTGVTTDPSGVIAVDLSVTPAAGVMRAAGRAGSDRRGACCPRHSSQSCAPARPTVSR
ncbi:DDE-type integrase/transposase/recombinase [Streptomyces sp. NPDC004008]